MRSQSVGQCMVLYNGNSEYKIEYLSTLPSSIGSGVEQALIRLALKYCLVTAPKKK